MRTLQTKVALDPIIQSTLFFPFFPLFLIILLPIRFVNPLANFSHVLTLWCPITGEADLWHVYWWDCALRTEKIHRTRRAISEFQGVPEVCKCLNLFCFSLAREAYKFETNTVSEIVGDESEGLVAVELALKHHGISDSSASERHFGTQSLVANFVELISRCSSASLFPCWQASCCPGCHPNRLNLISHWSAFSILISCLL